jgi:hypothetical protein
MNKSLIYTDFGFMNQASTIPSISPTASSPPQTTPAPPHWSAILLGSGGILGGILEDV